jgi:hypothetical protein
MTANMRVVVAVIIVAAIACGGSGRGTPAPSNTAPAGAGADPKRDTDVRCHSNGDCRPEERCDECGTSSCENCDDCIAICVPR